MNIQPLNSDLNIFRLFPRAPDGDDDRLEELKRQFVLLHLSHQALANP